MFLFLFFRSRRNLWFFVIFLWWLWSSRFYLFILRFGFRFNWFCFLNIWFFRCCRFFFRLIVFSFILSWFLGRCYCCRFWSFLFFRFLFCFIICFLLRRLLLDGRLSFWYIWHSYRFLCWWQRYRQRLQVRIILIL